MTTKLLVGLIPLFTACTIDFEMQLDVGFQEGAELAETLEEGQELFEEMSSDDSFESEDSIDEEGSEEDGFEEEFEETDPEQSEEEQSQICEIDISVTSEVFVGEDILVEWRIHGEPQADTVIALLSEQETIHLDFLLMEDTGYMLPSLSEQGEYLVYVASGEDLNEPDCFMVAPVNVLANTQVGTEPEIEQGAEPAICDIESPELSIEEAVAVKAGDKLLLEWDMMLGEVVEVVMYDLERPESVILFDEISDDGFYEIVVSEDVPRGMYGISFISVDIEACVHFEIEVIHDV